LPNLRNKRHERRPASWNFKVSAKSDVSVYGLGRFPVTLYYDEWIRLLDAGEDLRAFLEANKNSLKLKA
jgi:hypothetical protein